MMNESKSIFTMNSNSNGNKKNNKNKKIGKIKIFFNDNIDNIKNNGNKSLNNYDLINGFDNEKNLKDNYNDNKNINIVETDKNNHTTIKSYSYKINNKNFYNINCNQKINNNLSIKKKKKKTVTIENVKELIFRNKNKFLKTYEKCNKSIKNQQNIECNLCNLIYDSIQNIVYFQNGKNFLEFFFYFYANYSFLISTKTPIQIILESGEIFQLINDNHDTNHNEKYICKCCILKIANSPISFYKIYQTIFSKKIKQKNIKQELNNYQENNKREINDLKIPNNKQNILRIPFLDVPKCFNNQLYNDLFEKNNNLIENIKNTIEEIKKIRLEERTNIEKYFKIISNNDKIRNSFNCLIKLCNNFSEGIKKLISFIKMNKDYKIYLPIIDKYSKDNNEYIEKLKKYYKDFDGHFQMFSNNILLMIYNQNFHFLTTKLNK